MLPEEMLELAIGMVQQQTDVLAHLNEDIGFKKYIHDVVFAPVYFCDECEKDFKHKSALERHQLTHSQDATWSCSTCGLKFKHKGSLTRHVSLKRH